MNERTTVGRLSHRAVPILLVVLGSIVLFFAVFAIWAKRQLLETDTWTETSSELLENEDIRNAIADFAVTQLFANVDVQAEIEKALPEQLKALSGPASSGVRQLATEAARRALEQPKVQGLWEDANRAAHAQLLAIVEDKSDVVSTTGGVVTLDLRAIVNNVANQVGVGAGLGEKLPEDAAQLEVLRSDELEAAQDAVGMLRTAFWALSLGAIVLYALAIFLARGRRRETLRAVGFGWIVVGALALVVHNAAGDRVVDALTTTAAAEAPAQATWDISTSLLVEIAQAAAIYGIAIVIAAWLAGPTTAATWLRRGVAPYLRQPRFAYSALAVLLLVLFWWAPTEAFHRLVPSLLLVVLLAIGTEALRRQVSREFPDRVTTWSPEGAASQLATRMREARERRVERRASGAAAPATAAPTAPEDRVSQLERLGRLRDAGVLSPEEFAAEKERVLADR